MKQIIVLIIFTFLSQLAAEKREIALKSIDNFLGKSLKFDLTTSKHLYKNVYIQKYDETHLAVFNNSIMKKIKRSTLEKLSLIKPKIVTDPQKKQRFLLLNGDKFEGTFIKEEKGKIHFQTRVGIAKIDPYNIVKTLTKPSNLRFQTSSRKNDRLFIVNEGDTTKVFVYSSKAPWYTMLPPPYKSTQRSVKYGALFVHYCCQ